MAIVPLALALAGALIALLALALLARWATGFWIERVSGPYVLSSLDEVPDAARIVVLGCPPGAPDGAANPLFVARIAATAAAYHRAHDARVLCSGCLDSEGLHESDELARRLEEAGVPHGAIDLDRDAHRTLETIRHLRRAYAEESIVLVSQPFHLPRVLFLARRAGLDARGLPAGGPAPTGRIQRREALARLRAALEGMACFARGGRSRR
jgi:SanA protein